MSDWRREYDDEVADLQEEARAAAADLTGEPATPQGLHQGGWRPYAGGFEKWEDEAVDDYLYPLDLEGLA